jgi:PPK2 family polyphosphate:nucleotide phosphotransferase
MDIYRVVPGTGVDLATRDPGNHSQFAGGKKDAKRHLKVLRKRLAGLQRVLWADGSHRLLVVIQALDTGGKDGTIRGVFSGVNPQGVRVTNFKAPTDRELAHDYLWRIHQHTPAAGMISVFNRSHYEDVLVVRVLGLVPPSQWQQRYRQINAFEEMLAAEGTTILKFYLHVSKEEQAERLRARLDDPDKHWKFNKADLKARARWDEYMEAYEQVLARTSTDAAPWYVVPANHKWYRNIVVASTIVTTLESLDLEYPEAEENLDGVVIE